ncbi:H-NS histone family protein [Mangrovicoccus algicola]|uniref:H-NS histone family protein n=1 Tax=Mangrovicoccus algicola TaxID=2771008 RepID=A0A8J7CKD7_9RHOB|nr:H-NS histone family protein [Mangrovicoccus algicola]MBE3638671.1 H-NS histone family protein [Mangrovicoccus algicola]
MVDISKLSRDELEDLKVQIDKRMAEVEKEQKDAALAEMREIAQRHGVTLEEIVQMERASASPTGALPKYRDPENPKNTWTGRGRKPKWLVLALEEGANIEDFAI